MEPIFRVVEHPELANLISEVYRKLGYDFADASRLREVISQFEDDSRKYSVWELKSLYLMLLCELFFQKVLHKEGIRVLMGITDGNEQQQQQ